MENFDSKQVRLFQFLAQSAPNKVFISIIFGVLAGLAYSLIIPLILISLEPALEWYLKPGSKPPVYFHGYEISAPRFALGFLILCLFILVTRIISQSLINNVAIDAVLELRGYLYRRISKTPIADIERIGSARLIAMLTTDVPRLIAGSRMVPDLLINVVTIFGLLGFLIYLNIHVFLFILGTIIFGIITYELPLFFGEKYSLKARKVFNDIQKNIEGLIYGAKELKLNQQLKQAFFDEELYAKERSFSSYQKKADVVIISSITYGDMIGFFAIGVVTYVIAGFYALSAQTLTGVVMSMLYIIGPISIILNSMPLMISASVSLKEIKKILNEMPTEACQLTEEVMDCQKIRFENVRHHYTHHDNADSNFELGPISLTLSRGQVTFIVGGNGSGKTTLAKLLSLHYLPNEGTIYFDDLIVTDANRHRFRQSVSAIYSDFYLFSRLFGMAEDEVKKLADEYLKDLGLEKVVSIRDSQFSTTALSSGQRKRLALLRAYLENRAIYIFDEWASDQDPNFKKVFYSQILPRLRDLNKLVVVISHDERYFHYADRVVKIESGKILTDEEMHGYAH